MCFPFNYPFWVQGYTQCGWNTGCVSESGDFKNVKNSKCFHLFSFNTYEHNVYIKEFRFFQFQCNTFNYLTHWKQKSYFPKITSFRWPPFCSRYSVSLLGTSPITLWSISTGIRLTSCWIRCFNPWTVWGAGVLKTWDFRYPQRKKPHAEKPGDLAGHMTSPYLEITWLGNKFPTAAMESRAVWLVAPSCWKNVSLVTGWWASLEPKKFSNMWT